jgi:hypothetical protein
MAKMLSRTSDTVHPKIVIETIKTGDVFATQWITMVSAKSRLVSATITAITNATNTAEAVTSHTTDIGIHGHTTCHPRIF